MKTALSALALCAAMTTPALAFDITDMSTEERAAFRAEVRAYLLDNPEVIMEAVAVLEARQQEQAQQNDAMLVQVNAQALFDDGFSWVGGNLDGDITLVEFTDYRCGYCRKAHDEVSELVASDGNIRFIVKEFPILGDASVVSSQFAIATRMVAGDVAYKSVHDALITLQGEPSEPALRRLATSLGLDADAILDKMGSPEVDRVITETRQLAGRLQINGTPTFVLGDQMLRGYVPLDAMRGIVADLRDKG
ncbi:DsbA family protein [Mesobacterium sp. TK19101]|uniref:DsbA family protein n=1 Tax=Mesobacterium hydrothermale TaxID=3111907 RepID=A0ABU6HI93_9RHOB|nr:DsbA family protein [Mesobacterium sp. TK19101]MEC3862187.1 DsbA family protein [Mesobacterium sp. TK19101]